MLGWIKANWGTIASVAVSTVVCVGVVALTGGLGAPLVVALAAGGMASGVAGYATGQLIAGKPIDPSSAVLAGSVGALVTVGTLGVGRLLAPVLTRVSAPIAARVPERVVAAIQATPTPVRAAVRNSTVGAGFGGGAQMAVNAATGKPLLENVGKATGLGAATGLVVQPAQVAANMALAKALAPQRQALMEAAHARYKQSLENAPDPGLKRAAEENYAHVQRLLAEADRRRAQLWAEGYDPDRVKLQLLWSDTHKPPSEWDAVARQLLPELYATNPAAARFKAFLLHEEPAIAAFKEQAKAVGLNGKETQLVVDGIRGHNGPGTPGSWWGETWNKNIATEVPHPERSPLLGRPYPAPSKEAALPTFLDRHDSRLVWDPVAKRYAGGPVKFVAEGVNRKETLQHAWDSATEVAYDGTAAQMRELFRSQPQLLRMGFVRRGMDELGLTVAVRDKVRFIDPNTAEVLTPGGPVRVTTPGELWNALAQVPPDALRAGSNASVGFTGALR